MTWILPALAALLLGPAAALAPSPESAWPPRASDGGVNRVWGDWSWVAAHGRLPEPGADGEDARVRTHLAFVERWLRAHEPAGLRPAARAERARNLDRLHAYWNAGLFPREEAHLDARRPTFIDGEGRVCAVGFLVERTAGRDVAEAIARADRWGYLEEMRVPGVDAWIAGSGLTRRELAMIQPSYGYRGELLPKKPPPDTTPAQALAKGRPGLDRCFFAARPDRGFDSGESVAFTLTVYEAGGLFLDARLSAGKGPPAPALERCLETELKRLRFTPIPGGASSVHSGVIHPPPRLAPDGSIEERWLRGVADLAAEAAFHCMEYWTRAKVRFNVDPATGRPYGGVHVALIAVEYVDAGMREILVKAPKVEACVVAAVRKLHVGRFAGPPRSVFFDTYLPFEAEPNPDAGWAPDVGPPAYP